MSLVGPAIAMGLATVLLSACSKNAEQPKLFVPAVSVYTVHSDEIGFYSEFVARTEA